MKSQEDKPKKSTLIQPQSLSEMRVHGGVNVRGDSVMEGGIRRQGRSRFLALTQNGGLPHIVIGLKRVLIIYYLTGSYHYGEFAKNLLKSEPLIFISLICSMLAPSGFFSFRTGAGGFTLLRFTLLSRLPR